MKVYFTHHFSNEKRKWLVRALQDAGYCCDFVNVKNMNEVKNGDIVFSWNRLQKYENIIKYCMNLGAKIVVLENPYLKVPNSFSVGMYYHNSYNYSLDCRDNGERFDSFDLEIKPWKKNGKNIVVATQAKLFNGSGIGLETNKQPMFWDEHVIKQIRSKCPDKHIIFRSHPNGNIPAENRLKKVDRNISISNGSEVSLDEDLKDAYCVVVHSSNVATDAILRGIPVVYTGENVYLKSLCVSGISNINHLIYPENRKKFFNRMAWNQYTKEELNNGFLFNILDMKS